LSLSLFVIALSAVVDVALDRARGLLAPGMCDALLHCSAAVVGVLSSFGAGLASGGAQNAVIAGLGLIDMGAAAFLVFVADVGADGGDRWRIEAVSSHDHRVRGSVMAVLGSLLAAGGAQRTAELGMDRSLGMFALPAYALHGLWSLREESRLVLSH
jgi:hypothetical protein